MTTNTPATPSPAETALYAAYTAFSEANVAAIEANRQFTGGAPTEQAALKQTALNGYIERLEIAFNEGNANPPLPQTSGGLDAYMHQLEAASNAGTAIPPIPEDLSSHDALAAIKANIREYQAGVDFAKAASVSVTSDTPQDRVETIGRVISDIIAKTREFNESNPDKTAQIADITLSDGAPLKAALDTLATIAAPAQPAPVPTAPSPTAPAPDTATLAPPSEDTPYLKAIRTIGGQEAVDIVTTIAVNDKNGVDSTPLVEQLRTLLNEGVRNSNGSLAVLQAVQTINPDPDVLKAAEAVASNPPDQQNLANLTALKNLADGLVTNGVMQNLGQIPIPAMSTAEVVSQTIQAELAEKPSGDWQPTLSDEKTKALADLGTQLAGLVINQQTVSPAAPAPAPLHAPGQARPSQGPTPPSH